MILVAIITMMVKMSNKYFREMLKSNKNIKERKSANVVFAEKYII